MEYGSNNFGASSQTGNRMPSNRGTSNWGQSFRNRQTGFGQSGFRPQQQARPQPQAMPQVQPRPQQPATPRPMPRPMPQAQPQTPPRPAELYSQGRGAYAQPTPQAMPQAQPMNVFQAAPQQQPLTRPNFMPPVQQDGSFIRQGAPEDMMRRQVDPNYRYDGTESDISLIDNVSRSDRGLPSIVDDGWQYMQGRR